MEIPHVVRSGAEQNLMENRETEVKTAERSDTEKAETRTQHLSSRISKLQQRNSNGQQGGGQRGRYVRAGLLPTRRQVVLGARLGLLPAAIHGERPICLQGPDNSRILSCPRSVRRTNLVNFHKGNMHECVFLLIDRLFE
jgi:hypothetical protein